MTESTLIMNRTGFISNLFECSFKESKFKQTTQLAFVSAVNTRCFSYELKFIIVKNYYFYQTIKTIC